MKVKTSELIGPALDWAVAKCKGKGIDLDDPSDPWLTVDGIADQPLHSFTPSTDWSQGGPIIEREEISVEYGRAEFKTTWIAYKLGLPHEDNPEGGPTPLIAAMRCFCRSKLGDEVDVPDTLFK